MPELVKMLTKYVITLKAFKHAKFASEETVCFEANVYANGKKIGYAQNDGRGGCTDVRTFDAKEKPLMDEVDAYFKTLPEEEHSYESGGKTHTYTSQPSLEDVVYGIACKLETCKGVTAFRLKDMPKGQWQIIKSAYTPKMQSYLESEYGDDLDEVMNAGLEVRV